MSEEKRYFEEITPKLIAENGVVSLAIRPNQKSQYGTGGLSGKELQQRFDKLATLIISRYNEVAKALSSNEALEYLKLPNETTLADFIKKITDDNYNIVSTNPYTNEEVALTTILKRLYADVTALAAFTEYSEGSASLSNIYASLDKLNAEILNRQNAITRHNTSEESHADIREMLDEVRDLVNEFFSEGEDADNKIDRLHEIVNYLNSNKELIDELKDERVEKASVVKTLADLQNATAEKVAGAALLRDYFAKKEELKSLITSEMLAKSLEPYAKQISLGNTLKYFITAYAAPQDAIDGWIGKDDKWSIPTDQSVKGVAVDDIVLFRCFNQTNGHFSYVFATITALESGNVVRALSTSVIHSGASQGENTGIDASSIVTNLDDTSTDKVLAASVGALIKERIENAVKGLVSDTSLTEAIKGFVTETVLYEAITSAVAALVKRTDLDKTLANYALTTEVHTIANNKISEALEAFDPGFNLPDAATDIFAEAFLTNGSFALQYDLYDEEAACSGIGNCTASALEIGSLAKGLPVVSVTTDAFNGTGITSAILPETVGDIREYAFANCANLVCITLPKKLSDISASAFLNCANLSSIVYNGEIYDWNKITIDADNDVLTSATLYCIPDGVSVEANANGKSCTVNRIYFDAEDHADINLPAVIDNYTVVAITRNPRINHYTELTGLWLPDGVTSIERYTFAECNLMKTVRLPKALKTVGDSAFKNCTALTDIYYQGSEDEWNAIQFGSRWNDGVTATIHYNYGG